MDVDVSSKGDVQVVDVPKELKVTAKPPSEHDHGSKNDKDETQQSPKHEKSRKYRKRAKKYDADGKIIKRKASLWAEAVREESMRAAKSGKSRKFMKLQKGTPFYAKVMKTHAKKKKQLEKMAKTHKNA